MKLASLKGGRDGRLVVVSRDLAWCADGRRRSRRPCRRRWTTGSGCEPLLRGLAESLEHGAVPRRAFPSSARRASPLPRAYQWADGSAYVNHVELVRKARGAEMPPASGPIR